MKTLEAFCKENIVRHVPFPESWKAKEQSEINGGRGGSGRENKERNKQNN